MTGKKNDTEKQLKNAGNNSDKTPKKTQKTKGTEHSILEDSVLVKNLNQPKKPN